MVTAAARYENFSDSGDRLTGKFTTRYDLTDQFALRGSFSTGFRAPSLQQSALSNTTTNLAPDGTLVTTLVAAAGSPIPTALGIDGLDLETSTNFGAGFVLNPFDGFTLTVDLYQIEIDDRIVLGGQLDEATLLAAGQNDAAAALLATGAAQASFFSNAANTRTRGLDFVATYKTDLLDGDLDLTLAGNFNDTDVLSINSADGIPDDLTFASVDADFLENGQPGERVTFSANYQREKWGGLVRANYFGGTELDFFAGNFIPLPGFLSPTGSFQETSTVEAAVLIDLELSYEFNEHVRFAVGANNVFDQTPDELGEDEVLNFITGGAARFPVRGVPYGFNGGSYYLRLSTSF